MNNSLTVFVAAAKIKTDNTNRKERAQKGKGGEIDWLETTYNKLQSLMSGFAFSLSFTLVSI